MARESKTPESALLLRTPSLGSTAPVATDDEFELLPLELFQPDDTAQMDMLMIALAKMPEVCHHL